MNGVRSYGDNESIDRLLKRFKSMTEASGIIAEVKERQFYVKPSAIRHKNRKNAIRRAKLERELSKKEENLEF